MSMERSKEIFCFFIHSFPKCKLQNICTCMLWKMIFVMIPSHNSWPDSLWNSPVTLNAHVFLTFIINPQYVREHVTPHYTLPWWKGYSGRAPNVRPLTPPSQHSSPDCSMAVLLFKGAAVRMNPNPHKSLYVPFQPGQVNLNFELMLWYFILLAVRGCFMIMLLADIHVQECCRTLTLA